MLTRRIFECLRPQEIAAGSNLLGNPVSFKMNRTNPIEMAFLIFNVTIAAGGLTQSAVATPTINDFVMGLVRKVVVEANEKTGTRPVVNCSGVGLLEYASKTSPDMSRCMQRALALSQLGKVAASNVLRIVYPIFFVSPLVGEPLRNYCLLPVHTHPTDPVVKLDFANTTDFATAANITAISGHMVVVRREMNEIQTNQILAKGGFLRQDLIETAFPLPVGTSGDVPNGGLQLPLGGKYANMTFRQYRGGATTTRDVVDENVTVGQETVWQLRQGTIPLQEFRWKDLQEVAEWTHLSSPGSPIVADVFVAATSGGAVTTELVLDSAPDFAGNKVANTNYTTPASTILNFLGDGVEQAMELSGLLDAENPTNAGQTLNLFGRFANVATNPSVIFVVGHRFYNVGKDWLAQNL